MKQIYTSLFFVGLSLYITYAIFIVMIAWPQSGHIIGQSNSLINPATFTYKYVAVRPSNSNEISYLISKTPNIINGASTKHTVGTVFNTDLCCDNCLCFNKRPENTYFVTYYYLLPGSIISVSYNASAALHYYVFNIESFHRWVWRLFPDKELGPRLIGNGSIGTFFYKIADQNDQHLALVFSSASRWCPQVSMNAEIRVDNMIYDVSKNVKKECTGNCNFELQFASTDCVIAAIDSEFNINVREEYLIHFLVDPLVAGFIILAFLFVYKHFFKSRSNKVTIL